MSKIRCLSMPLLITLLLAAGVMAPPVHAAPGDDMKLEDFTGEDLPDHALWLDSLDLQKTIQDWGAPQKGLSVATRKMTMNGQVYQHGLGTHAASILAVDLKGVVDRFVAMVGVDDGEKAGSVRFEVYVDGELAERTDVLRYGDLAQKLSVDTSDAETMLLVVDTTEDGGGHDHANWGGAMLFLKPDARAVPETIPVPHSKPMEIASGDGPEPAIHGPRRIGGTPGYDFLFLIPATGEKPLTFEVKDLPESLSLDSNTGIITGTVPEEGSYNVMLVAKNSLGAASRALEIVAGKHQLALTPPMGWNSWNVWGPAVSDEKVREAADWMVQSGLAAKGYQYICIDDVWMRKPNQNPRDENGNILTNEKFPDMKALADYVHSKGLKIGIYSSPGPTTCQGYEGSYMHEQQDAQTYADWGMDYLKYDWCGYSSVVQPKTREDFTKPYYVMREALDNVERDIVYSLCQYGMDRVWEWGEKVGGNLWRTTGDITDTWNSMSTIGFGQWDLAGYAGPGHWNDPDMLVVGKVGWGPEVRENRMSQNEQITHITLWAMIASPLLIGCDMSDMDQFTVDVLGNTEVIDINQDPLGQAGYRLIQPDESSEIWIRMLHDRTIAVALFNRGWGEKEMSFSTNDIATIWNGAMPMRDVWAREDLGEMETCTVTVPAHGAKLIRVGQSR